MVNKNITLASLINFNGDLLPRRDQRKITQFIIREYEQRNRERENARAFVEEVRRSRAERVVSEITLATYFGSTRPHLFDAPESYFLRRGEDHQKDPETFAAMGTCQTKGPGF